MRRRGFLKTILACGIAPLAFVPTFSRAAMFYPANFGNVGQGNDTAAIQGAINAIRQSSGGKLVLDRAGGYVTDCLDGTFCSNLEIVADMGSTVRASVTYTQPLIDLCRSHNLRVDNLVITLPAPGLPGVVYPKSAFLFHGSDKATLNNVTVNGTASAAIVSIVGASSISIRDSQLINWDPNAPAVSISTAADWGISSMFYQEGLSAPNSPDVYFNNSELHQLGGAQWTTYMRNADHIYFNGGLSANFGSAHVLCHGYCSHITDIGRKFYKGDVPSNPHAQMVYQAGDGAAVVGHVVINPSFEGIPALRGGAGSFQYAATTP